MVLIFDIEKKYFYQEWVKAIQEKEKILFCVK